MQDARQIDLKERQIIEHEGHPLGGLVIHSGILRVAGHFPAANSDVTLAIMSEGNSLQLSKPSGCGAFHGESSMTVWPIIWIASLNVVLHHS